MARYPIKGVFADGEGNIVVGGTATFYTFNSSAPTVPVTTITCYSVVSGGSAVSGAAFTSDSSGTYECWIDEADYYSTQVFTVVHSKSTHSAVAYHFTLAGLNQTDTNMGIGTLTPNGNLQIKSASAGSIPTPHVNADELVLEGSDNSGLTIMTPNDKTGVIYFADEDSNLRGAVQYSHTSDALVFATAAATVATLSSGGNLSLALDTLTIADGGTVTQGTNKSTGVTLSTYSGQITTHNASLADDTVVGFTVTNTKVTALDCIIINIASVGTVNSYSVAVDAVASGSFHVQLRNHSGGALGEAIVLNFVVLRGASS